MSPSTPTKLDGRAVLFAVAELLVQQPFQTLVSGVLDTRPPVKQVRLYNASLYPACF